MCVYKCGVCVMCCIHVHARVCLCLSVSMYLCVIYMGMCMQLCVHMCTHVCI